MRRAGIDLDRIGLVVAVKTVAQPPHVGERDHMVGLAENAEHRTIDARDHVIERFGKLFVDLPFLVAGRAIPDQCRGDRMLGGVDQRMAAGLAHTFDGNLAAIDLRQLLKLSNCCGNVLVRFGILDRIPNVAAMQGVLVRMPVKKIRRDADKAVAGKALGEIAGVLHQAVALVHQHDGRDFFRAAGRHGEKRGQAAGAVNGFCDDFGHASLPKDRQRMPPRACGTRRRHQAPRQPFPATRRRHRCRPTDRARGAPW